MGCQSWSEHDTGRASLHVGRYSLGLQKPRKPNKTSYLIDIPLTQCRRNYILLVVRSQWLSNLSRPPPSPPGKSAVFSFYQVGLDLILERVLGVSATNAVTNSEFLLSVSLITTT